MNKIFAWVGNNPFWTAAIMWGIYLLSIIVSLRFLPHTLRQLP